MAAENTFKPEYIPLARGMAERGATDREIAEEIGVSERTLHRWKHTQDGFADELRLGKEQSDSRVEQSLYQRASASPEFLAKILANTPTFIGRAKP